MERAQRVVASSFNELARIAIADLNCQVGQTRRSCSIVCGPITTGGVGNYDDNMLIFGGVVNGLIQEGDVNLFNQIPYEACIADLAKKWRADQANSGFCWPVMDEFYAPLFEQKLIARGFFIPGWESSTGANFERKKIVECGGTVEDLLVGGVAKLLSCTLADDEVTRLIGLMKGAPPPPSVS